MQIATLIYADHHSVCVNAGELGTLSHRGCANCEGFCAAVITSERLHGHRHLLPWLAAQRPKPLTTLLVSAVEVADNRQVRATHAGRTCKTLFEVETFEAPCRAYADEP